MKTFVIILGVLCLGIAAVVIHSDLNKITTTEANVETSVAQPVGSTAATRKANASSAGSNAASPTTPRFLAATHQPGGNVPADPAARALKEAIDQLVSRDVTFKDKQAIWKQLIAENGRLDETMEALKLGATNNPDSADYQAKVGEANLKKASIVANSGGGMSQLAILGMTADQSFDNALKIDPANWDAQFFKAVSMSYWPAELNKGDEVVQRLSGLITQQDTQTTRPEFAMPYIALGQQYQKLGQTDNALQTWQAGAAKFPGDTTLQQKLATAQGQH